MKFGPMARVQRLGKSVQVEVDSFFVNLRTFKTNVLSSLTLLDFLHQCALFRHPFFTPKHPVPIAFISIGYLVIRYILLIFYLFLLNGSSCYLLLLN